MVVCLGYFFVFIGTIFLFVPLIYLELGRPKDFVKAFFNLILGFILIIKNNSVEPLLFFIFLLSTGLNIFYIVELFSFRWNQLTDKEKNKITTFLEFKNNLSKILEAINLGIGNLTKPINFLNLNKNNQNIISKKWVRNDKNDNMKL